MFFFRSTKKKSITRDRLSINSTAVFITALKKNDVSIPPCRKEVLMAFATHMRQAGDEQRKCEVHDAIVRAGRESIEKYPYRVN
jgi:hypothetical protein